jgi:long-chain acyl-CoA synthetase
MTEAVRPSWPAMSIAESHAILTAPGAKFEMETLDRNGRPVRVWKNGPKSLIDLYETAAAFGARTFIVYDDERVTFDTFRRATMAFARALIARGVGKGDRVAIVMRNQPEWPVVFYGAALAGAIATPLNAWWSARELTFALKQSGATVAVFDDDIFAMVHDRLSDCTALKGVYVSRPAGLLPPGVTALDAIIGRTETWHRLPEAGSPPVPITPEDPATLFYTSGTSGTPKGAVATHRAATTAVFATLFSRARAGLRSGNPAPAPGSDAPQKRNLLAIPLFHVTGCFSTLALAMTGGGMLIMMRKWDAETALQLIERERATAIGGVPTIAWQLLEHPARETYDLSSVDTVSYGGAPAAPDLVRRLRLAFPGAQLGIGWGMTETCATFLHHSGADYEHRPESCGPVTPVADIRIVDAFGRDVPVGSVGDLWVRGPHVVDRYWEMPDETAASFQDGWLKTGDLARRDDEGCVFIVDRAKDVIIRGGENIYAAEVESILYRHPAVTDAALVAMPHPSLGEEAGAVVTVKPDATVTEHEIKAFVRRHLAAFKTPARVLVQTAALPRNANGKIAKAELRKLFAASSSDESTAPPLETATP